MIWTAWSGFTMKMKRRLNLEIQKLQRTLQRLKRQKKLIEKLHEARG